MLVRLLAGLVVLVLGGAGLYLVMESRRAGDPGLFDPGNPRLVAEGREIYAAQCAGCHGAGGEGQPGWETATADNPLAPPHDGTGHTWEHPDGALFDLTKTGLSTVACRTLNSEAMPQFDAVLSDDQIVAVLSYVKSLWPEHIRRQNIAINAIHADRDG